MKNNVNLITYFLTRSLLLGFGLSLIFEQSNTDTYIAVILGIILGIGFIYIFAKITDKIKMPLNEYLRGKKFINILIRIVYFIYLIFLIFILLIIISTFIYSYFLPFTPSYASCIPLIFLACFLNTKSSKNISYVATILFVLSITIVILKTSLIATEFDFNNILPIMSIKTSSIFKGAIIFTVLTTSPILTLIGEEVDFKSMLKYYLISSFTTFIVLFSITLVMGNMINVYSYPEYSLLRKIRFFNFIENIENIISITWFFDIFICLSIAALKVKEVLNTKKRHIPFILVTIIMIGIHRFISDDFYNSMIIYKSFIYIFTVVIVILLLLLIIKNATRKKQHNRNWFVVFIITN